MKTVTYRGADDPRDRTTRYRIGEHLLVKNGNGVEVSDEIAAELEATEGQSFEVEGKSRSAAKNKAETAATEED